MHALSCMPAHGRGYGNDRPDKRAAPLPLFKTSCPFSSPLCVGPPLPSPCSSMAEADASSRSAPRDRLPPPGTSKQAQAQRQCHVPVRVTYL